MEKFKKIFESVNVLYSKIPANYSPDEFGKGLKARGHYKSTVLFYGTSINDNSEKHEVRGQDLFKNNK